MTTYTIPKLIWQEQGNKIISQNSIISYAIFPSLTVKGLYDLHSLSNGSLWRLTDDTSTTLDNAKILAQNHYEHFLSQFLEKVTND